MSIEEAEVIRKRAEAFLANAQHLLEVGEWDLAVFSLEQYCQLMLKYLMIVKLGSYSRTHSLRRLIRELAKMDSRLQSLVDDEDKLHYVAHLEEADLASRYFPYRFEEKEARSLYRFVVE
ncbi:MAG: HEPN domain-containing protein, partial [Candidatus Bathyarchaeota archaeon]|nr:HEPN domain-containing protein [Candidatus Bathyarchaeota archaeon]